jgi:prepilin-type N-terminal cleavage/methylation domain-containing protein
MNRRIDSRAQNGFTLIELMIVILVIAILSAIALSAFLGQRSKAHDGAAKSDARTVVSAMEACYTELARYDPCPDSDPGAPIGTGPGEVEITPSGDTYVIVSHSRTGNTFTVTKLADQTVVRTCSDAGDPRGGCVGGSW